MRGLTLMALDTDNFFFIALEAWLHNVNSRCIMSGKSSDIMTLIWPPYILSLNTFRTPIRFILDLLIISIS